MKDECYRKHTIRHLVIQVLEAKYSDWNYVFGCDLATAHYALRALTSLGTGAYRASASNTTRSNYPKYGP